jgi:DmsE family decaheme c-type cytochrome
MLRHLQHWVRSVTPNARNQTLCKAAPLAALLCLLAAHPAAAADGEAAFVGDAVCLECHEDDVAEFMKTPHAHALTEKNARSSLMARGCESCHGPGAEHVAEQGTGGKMITFSHDTPELIAEGNAACLGCHERGARVHWKGSPHDSRDIACTTCHTIMKKVSPRYQLSHPTQTELCGTCHLVRRAQTFRNAHMPVREGAMTCTSCHAVHGSVTASLINHDSINDTCYSCHAEKRGPFLWEHAPVTENCLNCHDPHGSTRARMLRLNPPRLCQQCHIETLHPTEARMPGNKFVIGRACLQCHANIHGSNHPSGHSLTR